MSPTDKPTGEVTNAVDPDDFGGGSSIGGLGSSTGNMTGNVDMDNSGGGNTNVPGSSYSSLATFATTSSERPLRRLFQPLL